MKIRVLFSYEEYRSDSAMLPVRIERFEDGATEIDIPEIQGSEAPIALIARGQFMFRPGSPSYEVAYRFWQGKLWLPLNTHDCEPIGRSPMKDDWDWPALPAEIDTRAFGMDLEHDSGFDFRYTSNLYSDRVQSIAAKAQCHLVIDGVWHRPAGEPRYVVMTTGVGRNHGATHCMITCLYNDLYANANYFKLSDREKAVALATRIAEERGDTRSLPVHVFEPEFEILIPEALTLNPMQEHGKGHPVFTAVERMTRTTFSPVGESFAELLSLLSPA